jgi:DNA modification methylase
MKHKIIIGDCRKALKTLPNNSVHLVVTSPPYNVNKDYGKWDDSMPLNEYLEFTKEWLTECYRVLTDDGRICVNYNAREKLDHFLGQNKTDSAI